MKLKWQRVAALIATVCWIAAASAQDRQLGELAKFASNYEQGCHETQAARLKALPKPASEIQKMQIEIIDEDVCPCLATRILDVSDPKLAARILAKDPEMDSEFFEPAFQQCSITVLRKMALPSCKADMAQSKLGAAAVEAACQCFSGAVAKVDDKTLREDAIAAYLNYEARSKDRSIAPYVSKVEVLRLDCVKKHS